MDINVILDLVTVLLVAVGTALAAGIKVSAEEGARAAIQAVNWPRELARELEKVRGTERQELRFESYGALWETLRPLALYDEAVPSAATIGDLSKALSNWYFSKSGGLMLTAQARNFYFSLQDLLRSVSAAGEWRAERTADDPAELFASVLKREKLTDAKATLEDLGKYDLLWSSVDGSFGAGWRKDVKVLATRWGSISPRERFAVLQQVGSALRTVMVNDVESRLR